jgi:hypothetical protein
MADFALKQWLARRAAAEKRRGQRSRRGLAAEQLENRHLLATITADFSDLSLSPESHFNGPDPQGTGTPVVRGSFRSGQVSFNNNYDLTFNSWDAFAYSNETDTTTAGFDNQFSSFTGGGNGDENFGVAYFSDFAANNPDAFDPADPNKLARLPTITLPTGVGIESIHVTNTTYAAISMRDGDAFSPNPFGGTTGDDPDFLKITAYATDASGAVITPLTGNPEFYLADYRPANNAQDYILDAWTEFDLSRLEGAKKIYFQVTASLAGTPTYFAIDDVVYTNTAPVVNVALSPQLGAIDEDSPNAPGVLVSDLLNGTITDPDIDALEGMGIVGSSTAGGTWQYSMNGTIWLDLGTPSESEARLLPADGVARLRFVPDANFSGDLSIDYRAWDQTEGTPGGVLDTAGRIGDPYTFSVDVETATQTVSPINDAPVLDTAPAPVLPTIAEDTKNPGGMLVADLVAGAISDIDPGALKGIGVISAPSDNGTWQYALNGTSFFPTWKPLTNTSQENAWLLPADASTKIRFVPKANFNGEVSIRFLAWDRTDGDPNGGDTLSTPTRLGDDKCFSLEYDDATITVTAINDAPVLDNSLNPSLGSILEDAKNPTGTLIKYLANPAVTDADEGAFKGLAIVSAYGANGDWQFSLDGTTWQSMSGAAESAARLLPVDATTRVRFVPKANFNGVAWISYRAWDQTEGVIGETLSTQNRQGQTKTFSLAKEAAKITITPVNDAPVVSLSGTVGYVRNNPAVVLAPFARVSDVDNANFDGGRLKVRIASGKSNFNLLAIGAGFTVDETFKVRQGSIVIGTLNPGGGDGTTDLIVTFNDKATKAIVQDLVRSITFRTLGGSAGTKTVKFSLTDGKGGTSAEATKTVNVT